MKTERIVEVKNGKTWSLSHVEQDEKAVFEQLSADLIAKKINCRRYIKSIKRTPHYNGWQSITVYYDNGVRAVYVVPEH